MQVDRPIVLCIGGHDPSGGAGITADLKTCEQHKVYGMSVITANTVQTEDQFASVNFVDITLVIDQLELLLKRYTIDYFKIGLIESEQVLKQVVNTVLSYRPQAFIIWDPILASSTGFEFHNGIQLTEKDLRKLGLITPNSSEWESLAAIEGFENSTVLKKGGHDDGLNSIDFLFENGNKSSISGLRIQNYDKHGTGCVLATAIACNLATEDTLLEACTKAKEYLTNRLISNRTLLAYHNNA